VSRLSPLLLLVALIAGFGTGAPAAAATVEARVDSRNATVGSAITLTITVGGVRSVGRAQVPQMSAFDVVQGPTGLRSVRRYGRSQQQVELTFYLYPKTTGSHTIDPFGVEAGGTTVWTQPLVVDVSESTAPARAVEDQFLEASIEPTTAYAGQVVIYHLRLGFASSVNNPEISWPDWAGLLRETSLEPELTDTYQVMDGRTFHIVDWRVPLFTLRPGEYEVGPTTLNFDQVVGYSRRTRPLFNDPLFDQLFAKAQLKPVTLETEPVNVEVLALPEQGRPESWSGLVGGARLLGDLSRNQCALGESATLTLVLQGSGNLRDVDLELEPLEGLKIYAEDPKYELAWGPDGPYGRVVRRFDLVPLVAGEVLLPELVVGFFEPNSKRYRTVKAGPFRLTVTPGDGADDGHGAHSADLLVDEHAIDMLTREPYPAVMAGGAVRAGTWPRLTLLALALAVPVCAFGGAAAVRRRRLRNADPELQRKRRALKIARVQLGLAGDRLDDRVAAAATAEDALRTYLAERADVATGALSPEELGAAVRGAGALDVAADLERWITDVAAVRYAGQSEPPVHELVERGRQLLARLEEALS
jgi:hypothetical protein